jgi:Domain of unknown function (DUF4190)
MDDERSGDRKEPEQEQERPEQRWAPFGPSGDEEAPEFEPPQTATPGPPPGAPPTPPPPTKPQPPVAPPPPSQAAPHASPGPPPPPAPGAPPPAYPPPGTPYGYAPTAGQRTSGKAVAALVLGICGWLVAPFILSVLGIVFGAMARKEIAANPSLAGRNMANWGFWLSITGLAAWVVLIVVVIAASGNN